MRVHKLVSAGAAAGLLSAILFTCAAFIQKIAVSHQDGIKDAATGSTKTCHPGMLGVFKSQYEPECSGLPGEPFTADTLEFWPLFPAQNAYGGVAEFKLLGLGTTPFNSCDKYMQESLDQIQTTFPVTLNTGLGGAVGLAYNTYNEATTSVALKFLQTFSTIYNATDIQASNFDWSAPAGPIKNVADLATFACKGKAGVNTAEDCAAAMGTVMMAPMTTSAGSDFTSPIGTSWANLPALMSDLAALAEIAQQAEMAKVLASLAGVTSSCISGGAVVVQTCMAKAAVPAVLTTNNYPPAYLFGGNATASSFLDFCSGLLAASKAGTLPAAMDNELVLGAIGGYLECGTVLPSGPMCTNIVSFGIAVQVFEQLYSQLTYVMPSGLVTAKDKEEFVGLLEQQCENGDESIKAIRRAQKMLIATLVFVYMGSVLAVVASRHGTLHKRTPAVASLFVVLGTVLAVVGLIGVLQAPVYALISEAPANPPPGSVVYENGVSMSLAIAAIAFGLVSSLCLVVGTFYCMPQEMGADDEKVEQAPSRDGPELA